MAKTLHKVAHINEIKVGKTKRVVVNEQAVLLANVEGKIYAVDDLCTHEDASLYLGCLKGDLVQCSLHGGKFNVRTGEPAEEPAEIPLQTWTVHLQDEHVYLEP